MSATSLDLWIKFQTTQCLPALSLRLIQAFNPNYFGPLGKRPFYLKLLARRLRSKFRYQSSEK